MSNVTFTVKIDPPSKSRARFTRRGSKVMAYTPEATKAGEEAVAWAFRSAARGWKPKTEMFYGVDLIFHCGTRQRRDIDNMCKLVLDALNGIAYPDDNAVTELTAKKDYVSRSNAQIEITVREIENDTVNMIECARDGCSNLFRTFDCYSEGKARRYCCSDCRFKAQVDARERVCQNCGVKYHTHGSQRDTKFCTRDCKTAYGRAPVICASCGNEFTRPKSQVRKNNYCSDSCRAKGGLERAKERKTKNFKGVCEVCGAGTTRKEYTRCSAHQVRSGPAVGVKRGPYKDRASHLSTGTTEVTVEPPAAL